MEDSLKRLKRELAIGHRCQKGLPRTMTRYVYSFTLMSSILASRWRNSERRKSKVPSYGALMEIVEAARSSPGL
ncbi:hypothetical protein MTO96_028445 [Rhipicephalus appendiculatus]